MNKREREEIGAAASDSSSSSSLTSMAGLQTLTLFDTWAKLSIIFINWMKMRRLSSRVTSFRFSSSKIDGFSFRITEHKWSMIIWPCSVRVRTEIHINILIEKTSRYRWSSKAARERENFFFFLSLQHIDFLLPLALSLVDSYHRRTFLFPILIVLPATRRKKTRFSPSANITDYHFSSV